MPNDGRTEEERCSDLVLLLHLIEKHRNLSRGYLGITKVDKYVFLSEKEMIDERVKGFDHGFFRWNFGPLAPSLYSDLYLLRDAGLVVPGDNLALTKRGIEFDRQVGPLIENNEDIIAYVDEIVRRFRGASTEEVTEFVYDIEIDYPIGRRPIREIPKGWHLIAKIAPRDARRRFEVSDSWVETIEILLDSRFSYELERVLTSPSGARAHPFEGIR